MFGSFIGRKFRSLLGVASISMLVIIAMQFIDSAIIGNFLGENALSATNLINPLYSASAFLGNLIAIGTGILFTGAVGRFDKDAMAKTVGQGIISAVGMGILIAILSIFGRNTYLDFFSVNSEVRKLAEDYYFFYIFIFALLPIYNTIYELVFDEGDDTVCWISSGTQLSVNVISSVILCQTMGIKGVGLGMLLGVLTSFLVLCIHFFRKTNTIRFKWFFSIKQFFSAAKYSLIDALYYLDLAIMEIAISKFIVVGYGDRYLPIFTVVQNILLLELVFDGVGLAMRPLVSVYRGEENQYGEKKLLSICTKTAIIEGLAMTGILLLLAGTIPKLLGITDIELINESATAIRYMSITMAFVSIAFLLSSYYLLIDKVGLGMVVGAQKDLLAPIVFGILIASLSKSIEGLWIGFAIAPLAAVAIVLIYVYLRYDRNGFPFILKETNKKIFSFEQNIEEKEIGNLILKLEETLNKENIEKKISMHLELLTEECLMLIKEKNGKKKIISECTLMIDENIVTYIIRDNGTIFDITDADNAVTSLRSMVLSSLMEHYSDKANLVTTSYNRNIFKFRRET